MVLVIYQIILHLNKLTECLKMTTFKIVFTFDVFFSAETTMHCKVTSGTEINGRPLAHGD
jgi:hypothetical protein